MATVLKTRAFAPSTKSSSSSTKDLGKLGERSQAHAVPAVIVVKTALSHEPSAVRLASAVNACTACKLALQRHHLPLAMRQRSSSSLSAALADPDEVSACAGLPGAAAGGCSSPLSMLMWSKTSATACATQQMTALVDPPDNPGQRRPQLRNDQTVPV